MRLALVASMTLVAACGSSAATTKGPAPIGSVPASSPSAAPAQVAVSALDAGAPDASGESPEDKRVAKMMKRVSRARGLEAMRPVPGVVLARDRLLAKVKEHVDREIPPEVIRRQGVELKLLGFLAPGFDYEAETFKLLEAQLAGEYEPVDATMYMAADLDEQGAEATLAHELVHALQDQHYDLKPHSKFEPGKSDEQAAFACLAEGDAMSAMTDTLIARTMPGKTALDLPEAVFVQEATESMNQGPTAQAPHLMRTSLIAPYIYGTLFVHALRRSGGWGAVDEAWRALPTTTEQILHVEKWRAHEPALDVAPPPYKSLGAGWEAVDVDTEGELGLRLTFEEWMGPERAAASAAGWGGDRMVLLEQGNAAALAERLRYDGALALREGKSDPFAAIAQGLSTLGKPAAKDARWVCIERPQLGPLGAMKRGKDVVLVAGPTKTGEVWSPAGDCALAKKWATEIAASP